MNLNFLCSVIKNIGIILCMSYGCYKILSIHVKLNQKYKILTILFDIILGILQCVIPNDFPHFLIFVPLVLVNSLFLVIFLRQKFEISTVSSIFSLAIAYITSLPSILLASVIVLTIKRFIYINYSVSVQLFSTILSTVLNFIFVFIIFRLKRLKYGFSFMQNEYLRLITLVITTTVLFAYAHAANNSSTYYLACVFISLSIIAIITIRQSFIIYQKQKLQLKALNDYETELAETQQKLEIATEEKENLIKANHEFYHRQEALKVKLNSLISSKYDTEFSNEIADISDRINKMTEEFESKLTKPHKIPKTNIVEIDDMLSYMQQECIKNEIDFIFRLDCNINKIIGTLISKSELETLLGDLIRNSIIAINNSDNTFKSIMVVFGLKDSNYEISVYDSGINFNIETLLKLGIEKASTHLDCGGTGIGFLTTFEMLANTNASILITEFNNNDYTKSITICFNNKHEYIINSYRANEISALLDDKRREIIIRNM